MTMTRTALFSVWIAIVASECSVLAERSGENRDHLLGWYRLENREVIIPVFKVEGDYYTVCRGAEIPLKPCPEGLEWERTGTKIIFDKESSHPYYISIYDENMAQQGGGGWGTGKKRQLTKVDKPLWLPNPTARGPRSMDDFLGRYVYALWSPRLGVEIRKDDGKYIATCQLMEEPGQWKPTGDPHEIELAPLPDRLGFTLLDPDTDIHLIYNTARERFELVAKDENTPPAIVRIPLARVVPETSSESRADPTTTMVIGIPNWH
jgi:hypothetical protein